MSTGEFLTRITIWLTIAAYIVGFAAFAISRGNRKWDFFARNALTIAALSLLAHLAAAYHFYHQWSHEAAYSETARQTFAVTGLNWGGGLYINYLVLAGFIVDAGWWWLAGLESYRRRSWILTAAWHFFVIFIIFNATVVFKTGVVRWTGLVVCLILSTLWLKVIANRKEPKMIH